MKGHYFDTKGFFFVLKAIGVISLFLFAVHTGLGYFETNTHAAKNAEPVVAGVQQDASRTPRTIALATIKREVPSEGKFLGVDLAEMKVYLYQDGELESTYDVLSKGKPGSRWETPTGSYTVGYKNEHHFSSIGHVYMPYSMQFFGNFFIHGWPEYEDGTPVAEGYSGGCIRLSSEDAKEIYEFADISTPLFVYEPNIPEDKETSLEIYTQPPLVSAKSYLVANLETGEVYAEQNADTQRPIASISKLMTAVVANESIGYNRLIYVSNAAVATHGRAGSLYEGQRMSLHTILHPLLLESSNDAATAISAYLGHDRFRELMNRKATALDMNNTHFSDPSGLSAHNTSTVSDLYKLAHYIYTKKKYLFDLTTIPKADLLIEGTGLHQTFNNFIPFYEEPTFVGGKNGYTDEARKTLLSVFDIQLGDENHPVAIIVLGSEDHTGDTKALLSWLKANVR